MGIILSILGAVVLCSLGTLSFYWALQEILKEKYLKRDGFKTLGQVVSKIPVKNRGEEYMGRAGVKFSQETYKGYFFNIEYTSSDGEIYTVRPKKVFETNKEYVEVLVNPDDPTDIMVDGFYRIGNQKYYQLIMGALFGPIPFLLFLGSILAEYF